jgi:hypothetical protein
MSLSLFLRKAVSGWVLALALALPGLLCAQVAVTFTSNGPEYAIAGPQPGDQAHPTAALSPLGGFLAWDDNAIDGFGAGIAAMALNSNLGPVGRPFRVNQIVGGDQILPQAALIPGGGAVFAWQGGPPSRQNIYARFLSSTNTWLTGDVMVNTFTANFRCQPVLAVLPNGNVAFAWGSYNQQSPSSYQDVYAQILSPTGAKVGSEFLVNQFTLFNQRSPAIAALSTGGFVIAWISEQQTHPIPQSLDAGTLYSPNASLPSVDVFARTFDSNGVALANEFIVNSNTSPCSLPAVAAGPNGGFIVAWTEKNLVVQRNSLDVFARTFSPTGTGGLVRMVNTYTLGDQYAPRIASVANNYLAVWTSMGQDGSWEGVYGQLLNQDGSPSGSEFRLNTTTVGRQMHGTVISDNTERFLALWTSFGSLGTGFDVYAQLVAPSGYAPSAPISTVFAPPASDPFAMILPPSANPLSPLAPSTTNNASVAAQPNPILDPLPPLPPLSGVAPSNAIAQAQGAYNGLIYNTNVTVPTSGFFTAKTTAKGAYSANLLIAGRNYAVSGKFSPQTGLATNTFHLVSGRLLTVRLRLDLSGTDRLQGVITDSLSAYVAQLDADRLVFSAISNPAPQRGAYTIAIPPDGSGPAGYGYGTMTVSPGGVIQWAGTLADGTKVSQTSALSKDGLWPLYCSIYGGGGAVISWMQFNSNVPESDLSGQFIWIKPVGLPGKTFPAGFTNSLQVVGSAFTPPTSGPLLNLTNLDLVFSGGGLQAPFTNSFTWTANRVTPAPGTRLKLTFSLSSGLFSGSTLNPETGQSLSFQGVVYEKAANGAGLFLTPAQSGQVYLAAPPSVQ